MYSNHLAQIMVAILQRNGKCSPERLSMLVFICDWVSLLRRQKRLTEVKWIKTSSAVSTPIIRETIESYPDHFVSSTVLYDGVSRDAIEASPVFLNTPILADPETIKVIDEVVRVTKKYDAYSFLGNVLGLFPVKTTDTGKVIDLNKTYQEYLKFKARGSR
ncbi:MAG: hypothetical protein BGO89_03635 [Candidatus Kapaibacterium thiocyanatum]|uniref:Uncharacterized protein n=1 Tax=Candidatus Kapaibacterium thiocyanatum TaxID=1895771 RepID=A0A1M3L598_9BACT|nr:MAG: hypothetical protein BGO89_03635 ['Candidatus Kapabacteria' thiocyanatum]